MADYKVQLAPTQEGIDGDTIVVKDADIGFNQFGWLCFTDQRRELVRAFAPGSVIMFDRIDEVLGEVIELDKSDFIIN
jgi:hypothetical protein